MSTKTVYLGAELKKHLANAAKKAKQNESFFAREAIAARCREILGEEVVGPAELQRNATRQSSGTTPSRLSTPKKPVPKTTASKTTVAKVTAKNTENQTDKLASAFNPFATPMVAETSPLSAEKKKKKSKSKKKAKKKAKKK